MQRQRRYVRAPDPVNRRCAARSRRRSALPLRDPVAPVPAPAPPRVPPADPSWAASPRAAGARCAPRGTRSRPVRWRAPISDVRRVFACSVTSIHLPVEHPEQAHARRSSHRPVARPTASERVAAHAAESFAFLPFAACVAFAPACLSRRRAVRWSFRAFLGALVAAWSMRRSALPSFAVTLLGIGWSAHIGLASAASNLHRAVVQDGVVVVVDGGADGGARIVVDVVTVLPVVVLATVANRRTSPPLSAT